MDYVIETKNLTKRYDRAALPALFSLDLSVKRGEIFGYLGPNGSGKTTTIRILLGLLRATSGQAAVFGLDVWRQAVEIKRRTGNLPAEIDLWKHMTGEHAIRYLAALRPGCDLNYAFQLAEQLRLKLNMRIADYSTGNKRKVGIIQALMHRPDLIILDEPTNGLDPLIRQTLMEILSDIRNEGRTVFFSSHILTEVQAICDRVAILRGGRLMAVENIADLRRKQGRWISIYTPDAADLPGWYALPAVQEVKKIPRGLQLRVTGPLDEVIKKAAQFHIEDILIEEPDLEEVFMQYYEQ